MLCVSNLFDQRLLLFQQHLVRPEFLEAYFEKHSSELYKANPLNFLQNSIRNVLPFKITLKLSEEDKVGCGKLETCEYTGSKTPSLSNPPVPPSTSP